MQSNDTAMNADEPSEAHLQGPQSRHTKANLAKEPVLCRRFRNTLYFVGHRTEIDRQRRRANT